jgi:predicted ATP-grasp superfamily ATP-dependent carboligase
MSEERQHSHENPPRAEQDWPWAVVTGAFQTGVVLMRDLAQRGLRVCCIDHEAAKAGFRTIYGKGYLCPNPEEAPEEWVIFMRMLAESLGGKPVLISSADLYVTAIADHAAVLGKHFLFAHSVASQALLATKKRQYELSELHGLPVPRTRFVTSLEEIVEFGSVARFPCLLKPVHFRDWMRLPAGHPLLDEKIVIANSKEDLMAKYKLAAEASGELVAQEIIEGPDTAKLVYLACYAKSGLRLGHCMVRQLRTNPKDFGSAGVVEPTVDEEADRLCDGFLRGMGYTGICEIELKRDSRDGQVKMIEANPRYSVTADAGKYAGVELGWLHYLDLIEHLTGRKAIPVEPNGRDFRHIVLERDSASIASYRKAGMLTWKQLLRSYRRPVGFFDFDWRDWRVTASTLDRVLRNLAGPALRKAFRRIVPRSNA